MVPWQVYANKLWPTRIHENQNKGSPVSPHANACTLSNSNTVFYDFNHGRGRADAAFKSAASAVYSISAVAGRVL
jgi:hypothetical protein